MQSVTIQSIISIRKRVGGGNPVLTTMSHRTVVYLQSLGESMPRVGVPLDSLPVDDSAARCRLRQQPMSKQSILSEHWY